MGDLNNIKKIEEAFESVEYPGNTNLITDISYPESYEMLQAFEGKHWNEISIETIEYWRMNLTRFTPLGFRYYLPAFLIAALDDRSIEIDNYLLLTLAPPKESTLGYEKFIKNIEYLDKYQCEVVYQFILAFFEENPRSFKEKQNNIISFWKSYKK